MITIVGPTGGDDTAMIQAELNKLRPKEKLILGYGRYQIHSPLVCLDKVATIDGEEAFFDWYGKAGVMLTLGFSPGNTTAGGLAGSGWRINGLTFHHTGSAEPLINNQSTALAWQNVYAGRIDEVDINGFGIGLSLLGAGVGCTGNKFFIRDISNCSTSIKVRTADANGRVGFCTENIFFGGHFQYGDGVAGMPMCHLDIAGPHVVGLSFFSPSFEGIPGTTIANVSNADLCLWLAGHYESTTGAPMPFNLDSATTRCMLLGARGKSNIGWKDAGPKPPSPMTNLFRPDW